MTTRSDLLLLQDVALTLWGPDYHPSMKPLSPISVEALRDFMYYELEQIATHLAAKPNISPIDARFYDARTPIASRFMLTMLDDTTAVAARATLLLGSLAIVDDAPSDGSTYGRNNAAWAVAGSTVGVLRVPTADVTIPANSSLIVSQFYETDTSHVLDIPDTGVMEII